MLSTWKGNVQFNGADSGTIKFAIGDSSIYTLDEDSPHKKPQSQVLYFTEMSTFLTYCKVTVCVDAIVPVTNKKFLPLTASPS
jgi:hypothetical protein